MAGVDERMHQTPRTRAEVRGRGTWRDGLREERVDGAGRQLRPQIDRATVGSHAPGSRSAGME